METMTINDNICKTAVNHEQPETDNNEVSKLSPHGSLQDDSNTKAKDDLLSDDSDTVDSQSNPAHDRNDALTEHTDAQKKRALYDDKESSRDSFRSTRSNRTNSGTRESSEDRSKSISDQESADSSDLFSSNLKLQLDKSTEGEEDCDDPDPISNEECDDPDPISNGDDNSEPDGSLTDPLMDEESCDQSNGPSFADICENLTNKQTARSKRKRPIEDIPDKDKADLKKFRIFKTEKDETEDQVIELDNEKPLISSRKKYPDITEEEFSELKTEKIAKLKKETKEKIHRISRKELEDLVSKLFVDKVLHEHELGEQRDLCRRMEVTLENNRKKAAQFHKEIEDLRRVTQRLQLDYESRKGQITLPMKIKRSVGVQVNPSIINKGQTQLTGTSKKLTPTKLKEKSKDSTVSTETSNGQDSVRNPLTNGNPSNKSGIIDLTDDDEGKAPPQPQPPPPPMVSIPSSALNLTQPTTQQLITLPTQSGTNQIVLLSPSSMGAGTTTLLVAAGGNPLGNLQPKISPVVTSSAAPIKLVPVSTPVSKPPLPGKGNPVPKALLALDSPPVPLANGTHGSAKSGHPAPLPATPVQQIVGSSKPLPPQPILNLSHRDQSIVLLWKLSKSDKNHESISSYQLYAYQEGTSPPVSALWTKVGSVKALELPMACTLTQFRPGHRYHFAVRAIDARARCGPFSEPRSIQLAPN